MIDFRKVHVMAKFGVMNKIALQLIPLEVTCSLAHCRLKVGRTSHTKLLKLKVFHCISLRYRDNN